MSGAAERFIQQGLQAEAQGRWRDACELYRKATVEAAGLDKTHLNLGAALGALGDPDGAAAAYPAAVASARPRCLWESGVLQPGRSI